MINQTQIMMQEIKIIYNTEVLKSNLCKYNEVNILVKSDITIIKDNITWVAFRYCAPFTTCIKKIDGRRTNNAKGLDLVIPMYNLLGYSSNYSDKTDSFYSEDEAVDIVSTVTFEPFM